jgi:predicted transcriptional regulator
MERSRKIVTSLAIAPDLLARLDAAADAADRSRSYMAGLAIETFLGNSETSGGLSLATPAAVVAGCMASDRGDTAENCRSGCGSLDGVPTTPSKNSGSSVSLPDADYSVSAAAKTPKAGGGAILLPATGTLSRRDTRMDAPAQPSVSDLARQNAARDAADAATKAARDAAHQRDIEYIRNIGKP